MLGEYVRIRVGMLLKVEKSFNVKRNHSNDAFHETVKIRNGSIIEIRYPFAWNFRTECDTYCNATPEAIAKHCTFFGMVTEEVRFGNKHKTAEIIKEKLYESPDQFELVRKPTCNSGVPRP
ncbi:hypothetical protein VPHK389_0062 [Vibrio phage K389]|nr:hypothetical protein SIPHO010v1_p0039 [Vibrio phage 268E42.1]